MTFIEASPGPCLVFTLILLFLAGCGGGGGGYDSGSGSGSGSGGGGYVAPPATITRSATLTGAQETPPVTTTATGRAAVIVNTTTMEITGGVSFSGLSATDAHIHLGSVGVPGGVIIGLTISSILLLIFVLAVVFGNG